MPDGEIERMIRHKALMKADFDPVTGRVTVRCPYCMILNHLVNPVDITRWIEKAGKKEVKVTCSKGHDLRFRSIDQWRDERQATGIQKRPGEALV